MVKKAKKFNYQKDLKKAWRKKKDKKKAHVTDKHLKAAWDESKSVEANYIEMGLASDPNKTLRVPKAKTLMQPEVMDIQKVILFFIFTFKNFN
jgi:hypothetical protein